MEAKKRTVACLVGGIFGMIVALLVKQAFEWLWVTAGMMAGASVAYLCYDFSQIIEKIPLAWQIVIEGSSEAVSRTIYWIKKPHPLLIVYLITILPSYYLLKAILKQTEDREEILCFNVLLPIFISFLAMTLSFVLVGEACARKKIVFTYFNPYFPEDHIRMKKFRGIPFSYKKFFLLAGEELFWILRIGLKTTPKIVKIILCIVFYEIWVLLGRFVWTLVKMIHSHGRVASALYSALGIFISCMFFARNATTTAEYVFAAIAGGVIGAALGSVSCKISERLGLVPTKQ
jgi:hypothetical protein